MKKILMISLYLGWMIYPILAGTTGKIAGKVTDGETGEPLPGANVIIDALWVNGEEISLTEKRGGATDISGRYFIINVDPGVYTVKCMMMGFQTAVYRKVTVSVDKTTKRDFELAPEALDIGEEVLVVAEREMIARDKTSSMSRVDETRISKLPVEDMTGLLRIQSGVTVGGGGDIHIRGGRSSEIAYWVDGINVTDLYDNSMSLEVDNDAVQELQVISGTFNAEYGQAMSGIVNVVTKENTPQWKANFHIYGGDYLSSKDDVFHHIEGFNPISNIQMSVSGPLSKYLGLFSTVRRYDDDGYLFGEKRFETTGETGDSSAVSMNDEQLFSFQNKLMFKPFSSLKFVFGQIYTGKDFHSYDHGFKLNPEGIPDQKNDAWNYYATMTHTLNAKTFYELNCSWQSSEYESYKYEDPYDKKYIHPDSLSGEPKYSFLNSGVSNNHFERSTETFIVKFDLTSQVNHLNQIKFGVEYKKYNLFLEDYVIRPKRDESQIEIEPFEPYVYPTYTPYHDKYDHNPSEFSCYFQDKIEHADFVVNGGIRFDYFAPDGEYPADPEDPNVYIPLKEKNRELTLRERKKIWYEEAEGKYQVSPRLGLAYPITDQGMIHFSYGHFLQIPNFQYLYNMPEYKVNETGSLQGVYGNPDLKPQKTVMYEIGLQQVLFNVGKIDVTGFYRDVRNWVSTSPVIETALPGTDYLMYVNKDYANVKGITLVYQQALTPRLNFDFQYTFQMAEGSNSDPAEEQWSMVEGLEPVKQLVPLDWDRLHTLNSSVNMNWKNGADLTFLLKYQSGMPYTPSLNSLSRQARYVTTRMNKNSRRKPYSLNLDLYFSKNFKIGKTFMQWYVKVYNLFDRKNPVNVFSDTGEPDYTLEDTNISTDQEYNNTIEEYLTRPDFYEAPRKIIIGLKAGF